MSRIIVVDRPDEYLGDKRRIVDAMAKAGYDISIRQAGELWEAFSDSMAAGWMMLPEDDSEIVDSVRPYFVEDPE